MGHKKGGQNEKGQIVSLDLFFAVIIFLISLLLIYVEWDSQLDGAINKMELDVAENVAVDIADRLVMLPGNPADWEGDVENAREFGLAKSPRNLDTEKVAAFGNAANYASIKSKLNLSYDFSIAIYRNNLLIYQSEDMDFEKRVINVERGVNYNGDTARFVFRLYK